jgi:hypothetical protein
MLTDEMKALLKMQFCTFMLSDDGSGRLSCSTALPNISTKSKKSIHFSKQKECQKTSCIENLQQSVKPKSSCEY